MRLETVSKGHLRAKVDFGATKSSLPMSNEFFFPVLRLASHGGQDERCVELVSPEPDELAVEATDWRRWIARWRTAAYAHCALHITEARSGHALERANGASTAGAPSRLLYRMLRSGEPDIARSFERGAAAAKWLQKLDDPDGSLIAVLDDPIWRLLDPTPLSDADLDKFGDENKALWKRPFELPPVESGLWHTRASQLRGFCRSYELDEGVRNQRWVGLAATLIELRRALNSGDLPRYCLAFHTATEFSYFPDSSLQFRLTQRYFVRKREIHFTVHDHLMHNFGRVFVDMRDAAWERYSEELGEGVVFRPGKNDRTHDALMFYIDFKDSQ